MLFGISLRLSTKPGKHHESHEVEDELDGTTGLRLGSIPQGADRPNLERPRFQFERPNVFVLSTPTR
jgi:hypothetical protein